MTDRYFYAGGEAYTADGVTTYLNLLKDTGAAVSVVDVGVGAQSTRHCLAAAVPGPVHKILLDPGAPASGACMYVWYVESGIHKIVKLDRLTYAKQTGWATAGIYTATGTITDVALSPVDAGWIAIALAGVGTAADAVLLKSDGTEATGWSGGLSFPGLSDIGGAIGFNSSNGNVLFGPKYHGSNYTYTWTSNEGTLPSLPVGPYGRIRCSGDGLKVIAGKSSGLVYISTDGGKNWSDSTLPSGSWYVDISRDGSRFVAAKNNGRIYTSATGFSWSEGEVWDDDHGSHSQLNKGWISVCADLDGSHLVATTVESGNINGRIYICTDYVNWMPVKEIAGVSFDAVPTYNNWNNVSVNDTGAYMCASEMSGAVSGCWISTNGGGYWRHFPPAAGYGVSCWSSDGSILFVALAGSAAYYTTNPGDNPPTWHAMGNSGGGVSIHDIDCNIDGSFVLIAPLTNGSLRWHILYGLTPVYSLAQLDPDTVVRNWYTACVGNAAIKIQAEHYRDAGEHGSFYGVRSYYTPLLVEVSKTDKTAQVTKGDDATVRDLGICACSFCSGRTGEEYTYVRRDSFLGAGSAKSELVSFGSGGMTLRQFGTQIKTYVEPNSADTIGGGVRV